MRLNVTVCRVPVGTVFYSILLMSLMVASCRDEFQLPEPETPKLFLFWYVHPDSVLSIRLTHSFAPLDTFGGPTFVRHATVLVYENDLFLDTLKEVAPGLYRSVQELKPVTGTMYSFTAMAQGFPKVTTPSDSIPSVLPVQSVVPTFTPVDYENAGTLNIQIELSRPVKKNFIGIRLHYFSSSPFDNDYRDVCIGNKTLVCDRVSNQLSIDRFCLEDYYCVTELRSITLYNPLFTFADGLLTHPSSFSLATYSPRSEDMVVKIGTANANYTNNYETNPFYSPVFLPLETDGGYAAIIFYNTYSTTLQF